ncbi:MAG TPA: hypothetical protein VFV03_09155 [Solirubrobacteraceae bacterium]|nr:hypothetical protein [Solirubrobacteraceae bacterium]
MSKPFIFRRPDESEEDAARRLAQESAEAEQASQAEYEDANDEIRPELIGAPFRWAELQALAQDAHPVVTADENRIIFKHGDLVGEWVRGEMITGTGPTPGYYYNWVEPGPTVAHFTGD